MTANIWVYLQARDPKKSRIVQIDRDDPSLDWNYRHTPPGSVRRFFGRAKRHLSANGFAYLCKDWEYCHFGTTAEECLARVNGWRNERIAALEKEIAEHRAKLVTLPEKLRN